jgi:hypothetical protein
VSTPANWKQGEDVILGGTITDEEAKKLYPQGWKTPKPYYPHRAAAPVIEHKEPRGTA